MHTTISNSGCEKHEKSISGLWQHCYCHIATKCTVISFNRHKKKDVIPALRILQPNDNVDL